MQALFATLDRHLHTYDLKEVWAAFVAENKRQPNPEDTIPARMWQHFAGSTTLVHILSDMGARNFAQWAIEAGNRKFPAGGAYLNSARELYDMHAAGERERQIYGWGRVYGQYHDNGQPDWHDVACGVIREIERAAYRDGRDCGMGKCQERSWVSMVRAELFRRLGLA